ncbi:NFX1-type zinc finger-containing protein 1-like [Copidosoma floridanum]|uniref:NFX1-type zinc finger-containing protein 1-like n=1 Tax=Copidosoma floridanum TaxID=29053 RepID=UPI0006C95704|nr:NFX1-type zinc finger-containing protein 1-like [Copidosoma floridanum]
MSPDIFVTTLRVLDSICKANFSVIMIRVFNQVCSNIFLKNLESYITNLPFESSSEKKPINYIMQTLTVVELMPRTAGDKLTSVLEKAKVIISSIESTQNYSVDDKVKDDVSSMICDLQMEIRNVENSTVDEKSRGNNLVLQDYRTLSVIPTIADFFDRKPDLRPCNVKDAYDSVEQYLDTQFRLLREDFVRPLRNGIKEYLDSDRKRRNNGLRIYRRAKLMDSKASNLNAGIQLYFGKLNFVNWKSSKRFMFGGLLLLSKDNFKTIVFATVANRDEKELAEGIVRIELCLGTVVGQDMYDCNLVLLESKIYFEPYFVILNAMKNMNEHNFPMKRYLIECDTTTRLPHYLEGKTSLKFKDNFLLPLKTDDGEWPSAEELKFDESQYRAFKSALTQELAIIQGPPGTGKTFLALQIIRTLLDNKSKWLNYGPIVVVCLTNHALDQFLEGILSYTKSVVRAGSRSKSENLKPYLITEKRKMFQRENKYFDSVLKKTQMVEIRKSVEKLHQLLKYFTTANCIVPLEVFYACRCGIPCRRFANSEQLVNWLFGLEVSLAANELTDYEIASLKNNGFAAGTYFINKDFGDFFDETANVTPEHDTTVYIRGPIDIFDIIDKELKSLLTNETFGPLRTIRQKQDRINKLDKNKIILKNELECHPLINKTKRLTNISRWQHYWTWIEQCYNKIISIITELEKNHHMLNMQLKQVKHIENYGIMRSHEVVGITTTGAAQMQQSLRALGAPIVLVEEAAEILEAHVVCALTKHCQQLILIGDHKQLRPKACVYELGSKYNLNVSLFERMVNIRGECPQLAHQHRMRPEIAKLVSPIYENLYNHKSVLSYPCVKGLDKNLFFLNHTSSEESHEMDESWVNKNEVEFFSAFAKHLLMQGYSPKDITILCTYTGQLFDFMNKTSQHAFLRQVRITTVDNYQGEENKIILLSLVRNNGQGNIGFLAEENRVCVALSRAREGLFIMGNMSDLLVKNDIWPKIKTVLEEENAIGDYIKLRCQNHPDQFFEVSKADHFQQCLEGGCSKKCDTLLSCGHYCSSICHVLDRQHEKYQCREKCLKSCPNDHPCKLLCWQGCQLCKVKVERTLKCGHTVKMQCSFEADSYPCDVELDVILSLCNHAIKKPCYESEELVQCTHKCEIRLDCGHACVKKCHANSDPHHLQYSCRKDCTKLNANCSGEHICKKKCFEDCDPCKVLVDKIRSCGHHFNKVACSLNVDDEKCEHKCNQVLSCGHKCRRNCSDECINCSEIVKKKSSCGHTIGVKCCEEATPSKCSEKCPKTLTCGHPCTKKCMETCTVNCKVMVQMSEPGMCGHIFSVPCHLKNSDPKSRELMKYCKRPCDYKLACSHSCKGNCASCVQGRIHASCTEPCRNIFICGHACQTACNRECQTCTQKCEVKCHHSKCGKKCGVPCVPCREKCQRSCKHKTCSKRCHELCDIEPCNEPCAKKLRCNHPCIGFCGEPCPSKCRICNKAELSEIFLGNEDDPNARFILLPDCKHIIESEGLMNWIKPAPKAEESLEIKVPTCPRCKTPIRNCMRIMNQIKIDLRNVIVIKKRLNIEDCKLEDFFNFYWYVQWLKDFGGIMRNGINQYLSIGQIDAFKNILDILVEISSVLKKIKKTNICIDFIKDQVNLLIESLPTKLHISKQRLDDIQLEIRRLHLMVQVYNIFSESQWLASENKKEYEILIKRLSNVDKFTDNIETEIISNSKKLNEKNKQYALIERSQVITAVGLKQGHWFKCPNGHYYAIGECGGAMERSKCIECRASIGGVQHRLDPNNTLANEIDGAVHPAWPTALNH